MYEASSNQFPANSRWRLNSQRCVIEFTRSAGGTNVRPRPRKVPKPWLAPGGLGTPVGKGLNRLPQVTQAGARVKPLLRVGTRLVDCEKPGCCTPSIIKGAM